MLPYDLYYQISLKLINKDLLIFLEVIPIEFDHLNNLYIYLRLNSDFGIFLEAEDYYGEILDPIEIYKAISSTTDHKERIEYAIENRYYSLLRDLLLFPIKIVTLLPEDHLLYKTVVLENDIISTTLICSYIEDFTSLDIKLLLLILDSIVLVDHNIEMYVLVENMICQLEGEDIYKQFKDRIEYLLKLDIETNIKNIIYNYNR